MAVQRVASATPSAQPVRRPAAVPRPEAFIFDERLFQDVLIRERGRAARSDRPIAVLLVTLVPGAPDAAELWKAATTAVRQALRGTDVVGWLKTSSTLGVVLTDLNAVDSTIACRLQQRIRQFLAQRISVDRLDAFTFLLSTYPDPQLDAAEGLWPIESLIGEVRSRGTRAKACAALKRMVDLAGSLVLLAILSPLWLLIGCTIKASTRGPALFKQVRVGEKGKQFEMIKFRTMEVNADDRIHQAFVTDLINAKAPANGLFKIVKDPRVTPIGRVLRKTSLDELPQLWNVLHGEMSLVGPRPPLPYEVKQYKAWHRRRILEAKPGMTGLWQVKGRSRTTFDEMVRLDLQYARTRSLWTDLKIILATPAAVITGKGAC